jgi:hypothetical protein
MSYAIWADFVYYQTGNVVSYNTVLYQALQANINVVPSGGAPNWQVVPTPTSSGVASLSGGSGILTQSCLNGTYSLVGNNIELAIAYPVVPPYVPPTLSQFGTGALDIAAFPADTSIVLPTPYATAGAYAPSVILGDAPDMVSWVLLDGQDVDGFKIIINSADTTARTIKYSWTTVGTNP